MKTKIKRHSRSVISVILAVCMLFSCMTAGIIATDAAKEQSESVGYNGGSIKYQIYRGGNAQGTEKTVVFTLSGGTTGNTTLNISGAQQNDEIRCTVWLNNDKFGGGVTVNQGTTDWLRKQDGTFTIKITDAEPASSLNFDILDVRSSDNPPSLRYKISDNKPDYYVVGTSDMCGQAFNNNAGYNDNNLVYNSSTGLYQKTYTNLAASTDFKFRVRNKGRGDWDSGSNYGYSKISWPISDASSLVNSLSLSANDSDNIILNLKSNANVTVGVSDSTGKVYLTVEPTTCTVVTNVTPSGAGTATVNDSSRATVDPGATVTLAAAATDSTKYEFSKWAANKYLAYANANNATTTATVTGSANAIAQFTKKQYTVTCTTPTNGTLTADKTTCAWGETVTVTATPASGYTLDTISVNGTPINGNTFEMPVGNVTVTATFHELNNYSVTYGDDGNGYVSVGYQYSDTQDTITQSITSGATDVVEGSKVNFCAIPKPGYKFDGWYTAASDGTRISTTQDETVTINDAVTRYAHFSALAYKPEANKIKLLIAKSAVDAGDDHQANPYLNYWGGGLTANTAYEIPTTTYYSNINGKPASSNYYLVVLDVESGDEFKCTVHNSDWTQETNDLGGMYKNNTYIIEWGGKGKKEHGGKDTYSLPTAVYPITLNVTNAEMGTTYVKAYAEEDSVVTVNATPADNNKVTVTANSADVTATKKFNATTANPNTVTVDYAAKELYTVTFSGGEGGSVTATADGKAIASGDKVPEGTDVIFTPVPDKNYIFSTWENNATTNPRTVTVNADTTVTATFADISYAVVNGDGNVAYNMKKLPNGTWISTEKVPKNYWFSIKRLSDNYYSHSGGSGNDPLNMDWLTGNSAGVTGKVNGRWYSEHPTGSQLYKTDKTNDFYVVYDPNAICKNEYSYDPSCHKGRMWLTTDEDGLYPVTVYLKDGTIRNDTDAKNNTTARFGVTTLVAEGTTSGLTAADDTSYGTKTVGSTTESLVKKVTIPVDKLKEGVTLHIRTDIIDYAFNNMGHLYGNSKDFYVKGFDVNGGLTRAIISQEYNSDDEQSEKASYPDREKIHGTNDSELGWNEFTLELQGYTDSEIEVTPIYFKKAATSPDNVRFYATDFAGQVKENWRGGMAVYPYIESTYDPYGYYPGQLMVNEGGRYMLDIPSVYSATNVPVQGLTMNNFIWDDVHKDIFFPDISERSDAHYQTYDYNEFEVINKVFLRDNLDEDIIFSFKYMSETTKENSNLGQAIYYRDYEGYVQTEGDANYQKYSDGTLNDKDYRKIQPTLSKAQMADAKYKFEDLTDFYGNKVDIMGNLVADNPDKENYNPIYIISNGYDYNSVGKYATAWAYYKPVDDSGNEAWTGDFDHYELFEVMGGMGNQTQKYGSESYLIDPEFTSAIQRKYTNQSGTAAILDCENVPCKITYEHEIKQDRSNLKDILNSNPSGEEGTNMAYRSDGRWYYSNSDQLITAHTIIATVSSETATDYARDYYQADQIDFTKAEYDRTANTGLNTNVKAYFTNDGTETVEGREIVNVRGNTEANSITDGEHTFDMKAEADEAGEYMFLGWYLFNGTDYILASTDMEYSQEAKSNDVFAAVFTKVPSGNVVVSHTLTGDSTGSADTTVQVQVKDGETVKYDSGESTASVKLGPTYIKSTSTYNMVITLKTVAHGYTNFDQFKENVKGTVNDLVEGGISGITSGTVTFTQDTTNKTYTAVVTVPIQNLFETVSGVKEQKYMSLPFFSKVSRETVTYALHYKYKSNIGEEQYYGAQEYLVTGTFTEKEMDDYLVWDTETEWFKFNTSTYGTFLASKCPYEKNIREDLVWDYTNMANNPIEYIQSNHQITVTMNATQTAITKVRAEFRFPCYAFNTNDGTEFYTDRADGKIVKIDEDAPFSHYDDATDRTYKKYLNIHGDYGKTYRLNREETEATPTYVSAPDKIYNEDVSEIQYFQYWSVQTIPADINGQGEVISAEDKNRQYEIARCYNLEFNFTLYQNYIVEAIYGESISTKEHEDSASITFVENGRNQWNFEKGKAANAQDDRIFSDFMVAFDRKDKLLLSSQTDVKAGVLIERIEEIPASNGMDGGWTTKTEKEYATKYGTEGGKTEAREHIANNFSAATVPEGRQYMNSFITLSSLDNKNRAEYIKVFANVKQPAAGETSLTPSTRKNYVYRAYSYMIEADGVTVTISNPVYFTIYDIATIADASTQSKVS